VPARSDCQDEATSRGWSSRVMDCGRVWTIGANATAMGLATNAKACAILEPRWPPFEYRFTTKVWAHISYQFIALLQYETLLGKPKIAQQGSGYTYSSCSLFDPSTESRVDWDRFCHRYLACKRTGTGASANSICFRFSWRSQV